MSGAITAGPATSVGLRGAAAIVGIAEEASPTGELDISGRVGVVAALQKMDEYKNTMVATPLIFGPGQAHAPNLGSKVITINGGKWVTAPGQNSDGFTIVEPPSPPK